MSEPNGVTGRRGDLVALGVTVVLVATAVVVGLILIERDVPILAPIPPLIGTFRQQAGIGTPLAIALGLLIAAYGPAVAARLRWLRLLLLAWVTSALWILAVGLIVGWDWMASRLEKRNEYLIEVPDAPPLGELLSTFADRIVFGQPDSWIVHVAGHPPGALLFFVWLDRIGLGGGAAGAAVIIVLGASACVAIAIALRALERRRLLLHDGQEPKPAEAERMARRALPFLVLTPAATWIGVSADGMFLAVSAWGIALLAVACGRAGALMAVPAIAAGLLLGWTVYLSYGLVLMGTIAVAVLIAARRLVPGIIAFCSALVVAAAVTAGGFAWWEGLDQLLIRYAQGAGGDRPYAYWVWANLAAAAISAGFAVAPGLRRVAAGTYRAVRDRQLPATGTGTAAVVLGALTAIAIADISGLSKAEVERIWLPFLLWLLAACAFLPRRDHRWWLGLQATIAIAVEHLVRTSW